MRRYLAIWLVALLAIAAWLAVPASADDGAPNNVVLVTTTAGNPTADRSHVQVASYGGDTLDSTNLAEADSHDCTGCHTVAVAVQAVFASGNPSSVTPKNLAVATNENCTSCATFAFAYQYVVTTDGPIHLTEAGRQQLADLREKFREAANSAMSFPDLDARLHDLADQFRAEINAQVRRAGERPDGTAHEQERITPDSSS